jgi:hypothetical protein
MNNAKWDKLWLKVGQMLYVILIGIFCCTVFGFTTHQLIMWHVSGEALEFYNTVQLGYWDAFRVSFRYGSVVLWGVIFGKLVYKEMGFN